MNVNSTSNSSNNPAAIRVSRLLDSSYPLTRDDVIWLLEYIKKKVADADPKLLDLSQPHLLKTFHSFAEASMSLIQRKNGDHEVDRLRRWLKDAVESVSSPLH
ncbi:hypothetical protein DFQ01_10352 [Paenibacillus cellulosilyticus]|uniref:Uncharacterized protein n=1 Tax=Paenibacillus cellulosilyticus TaxID=375489 RepID=A0A2V2YY14_9BACL|nr:hypothetical protein [Paenibacillus cellulosilyticus]PWW06151.1 hypothetical protein DFQ01_10352 [Paenibacillus cellulosilyticus]QKS43080.1 hypothetical protein HUB94_00910 [Paenibacillus cellulosilyticus]